jgi:hypothetical protein
VLTISDPYDLKPADVYRQARNVASKTSRGSDGNWYKEAGEIAHQWHLWFDGGRELCSATFSRPEARWRQGPSLPLANFTTGENLPETLGELLAPAYFGVRPKSLGVILHVADDFSLTEVAPNAELTGEPGEDFGLQRYNLIDSPKETLADKDVSPDTTSWRLLPFWGATGAPRCTAVALLRQREAFLSDLVESGEKWHVPVRVAVTSAPLEALASLTLLKPDPAGGRLVAFPYLKFTAVFALNEAGELRAARSLSHRGNSRVPAGFGDILWNMAVSAELVTGAGVPQVTLVSADPDALEESRLELETYSLSRQKIACEILCTRDLPATLEIPGNRPEFLLYDPKAAPVAGAAKGTLGAAETFRRLWDGWSTQNFFHTAKVDMLYPSLADLRLLRFSNWFVYLLIFSFLGLGGYTTFSLFAAMNHESWQLTPEEVKKTQSKHTGLLTEEKQINLTGRLLLPRSQGWAMVEVMMQLFPEESGARLESYTYNLTGATPSAPLPKGAVRESLGLVREWRFKGLAKPQALALLNGLNSQRGLSAFFSELAATTGDTSFSPEHERQVRILLTQGRNLRFNNEAGLGEIARDPSLTYPFTFEATITQTLTEKDPLAVPLAKPF